MEKMRIVAKPRTDFGGGFSRRLRVENRVPAVLYGDKKETLSLSLDKKALEDELKKLRGENAMFELKIEGSDKEETVFVREAQRDPLSRELLHIDFLRINETQKIHFTVLVHPVGNSIGVKQGGILDTHLRSIDIKCLAKDLIAHIDVDVSALEIHQSVHINELKLPDSIEVLNSPSDVVITVLAPKLIEEDEGSEEEEESAEPEVIGEKKE